MNESQLQVYAELAVRVALNVQPGQRLMIIGASPADGGASLEAAPLAREIAAAAYRAGSPLVETIYGDERQRSMRFKYAPRDSFDHFSGWLSNALRDHVGAGHAVLLIAAGDPDLLAGEPPDLVSAALRASLREMRPFSEQLYREESNWTLVAAPSVAWAAKIFPGVPPENAVSQLWWAIARSCRLDTADPLAAWESHLDNLAARTRSLNGKKYSALKYTGPGTNLTLGLPEGHIWVSGRSASRHGTSFLANFPTEEVFTIVHKDRVDGTVRASKPLSYGGTLIENFTVTFERGSIVRMTAERNADALRRLLDGHEGARRLGEVALVPHSSPISQSGILYYSTLFDENAASHVALGQAFRCTLQGGNEMSDEDFERAGGNCSRVHVDFMIGSGDVDVDGVFPDGTVEPVMRRGEWAM